MLPMQEALPLIGGKQGCPWLQIQINFLPEEIASNPKVRKRSDTQEN